MFSGNFFTPLLNLLLILFVVPSYGSNFLSSYVTFDISDNWNCKSFGVDWICHHTFNKGDKPAMMLITAHEGRVTDNLNSYFRLFDHRWLSNQKIHVTKISVYGHTWLDAFYKNRLPGMLSRYVTTVCCDNEDSKIHVSVGFYAHDENYPQYSNQFLRSIQTLKLVNDIREALKKIRSQTKGRRQEMMSYIERIIMGADREDLPLISNKGFDSNLLIFSLLIFFVSGVFYIYYRRRNRRRRWRRRKRRRVSGHK